MLVERFLKCVSVLAVVTAALQPAVASAQAQSAVMRVGATVAPTCRITVEAAYAASHPVVIASCTASGLRILRVETGDGVRLRPLAGRQLRAGGEAVYVLSRDAMSDGRAVVVTLDF